MLRLIIIACALCTSAAAVGADPLRIVLDLPADSRELAEQIGGSWIPWLASRHGAELQIGSRLAPGETAVALLLRHLPADATTRSALEGLPIRLEGTRIVLAGETYPHAGLSLAVRLQVRPGSAWLLLAAADDALVDLAAAVIGQELGERRRRSEPFDFLLQENPWLERSGVWQSDDAGVVRALTRRDDFAARSAARRTNSARRGARLVVRGPAELLARPEVSGWVERLDRSLAGMAARVPCTLESPLELLLEPDYVAQGRHMGRLAPALLAADGTVVAVYSPDEEDATRHALARALVQRSRLDRVLQPTLEQGAALWLSGRWLGRSWQDWLPRLVAAGALPDASQLAARTLPDDGSALLWTPVAAGVVAALPGATLAEKLAGGQPARKRVDAALAGLAKLPLVAPLPRRPPTDRFLHGVSMAMKNGLDVGYHAPSVDAELARLAALGADAVALMPFAYQPDPRRPELRFLNRSPSSETDAGVVHAARRARAAGLTVLWKPHIWVAHDSWPGEIEMDDEEKWTAWFHVYRRFLLHHAALAEHAGVEQLAVGVELGRTVEREAEWRSLIHAVRLLYSGELTYAGNWHGDWERVAFWDALDLIGIDAYFPLSADPHAGRDELTRSARALGERLANASGSLGRRLLLTEVGFAARRAAWIEPHREGGEYSEEHQALAYRALLDGLGRPDWLAGLYLWKAFSGGVGGDAGQAADFRFLGRPAEAEIGHYFAQGRGPAAVGP